MSLPDPNYVNPRGIPQAPFVENVSIYGEGEIEETLTKFQETLQKYRYMESKTAARLAGLNDQIPDIQKSLDMVVLLKEKHADDQSLTTHYELNDTLYAKAVIPPTDKVLLWLGANVSLEYPVDEAEALLKSKLDAATNSKAQCVEDLEFLRQNITIMEVNTARLYNWDVQRRRSVS